MRGRSPVSSRPSCLRDQSRNPLSSSRQPTRARMKRRAAYAHVAVAASFTGLTARGSSQSHNTGTVAATRTGPGDSSSVSTNAPTPYHPPRGPGPATRTSGVDPPRWSDPARSATGRVRRANSVIARPNHQPAFVDGYCDRVDPVARHHHPRQLERRHAGSPSRPLPRPRHLNTSLSAVHALGRVCLCAGIVVGQACA